VYYRVAIVALSGIFSLTLTDLIVKVLSPAYTIFHIAFLRYAFGSLACVPLLIAAKPGLPSGETFMANSLRSILVVVTTVSFFYALSALPFAEAVTLSFAAPIFIIIFSRFFLKEKVTFKILTALSFGIVGTIVILGGGIGSQEHDNRALMGVFAALFSAITYALNMVLLRQRAKTDSVVTIVTFQNFGPALILLGPAINSWSSLTIVSLLLFIILGALGLLSHILLSMAYSQSEAGKLAPIEYTSLMWAAAFGYVLFGETISIAVLVGAALIIGGAIITSWRCA